MPQKQDEELTRIKQSLPVLSWELECEYSRNRPRMTEDPVQIPRTQLKTQTATDVPIIMAFRRQRQDLGARWLLGERPCTMSAVGLYT